MSRKFVLNALLYYIQSATYDTSELHLLHTFPVKPAMLIPETLQNNPDAHCPKAVHAAPSGNPPLSPEAGQLVIPVVVAPGHEIQLDCPV